MAIPNDMTSAVQVYVQKQSNDAVTEPTNGSWIAAYCLHLGINEPSNGSWLQALCEFRSVREPKNGSWVQALAVDYHSLTAPLDNSWWIALANVPGGAPTPPPFVWSTNTRNWETETRTWSLT